MSTTVPHPCRSKPTSLANRPCSCPTNRAGIPSRPHSSKERQFMLHSQKMLDSPLSEAHLPHTYSSLSCFSSITAERPSGLVEVFKSSHQHGRVRDFHTSRWWQAWQVGTMDISATVHLLSGPKQSRTVRGTPQVIHSQLNASCNLAPGNGPKCHLRPQTCHSKRTSASSRRTLPRDIRISKAFSMTSQILTHPKELHDRARRVSTCAFD